MFHGILVALTTTTFSWGQYCHTRYYTIMGLVVMDFRLCCFGLPAPSSSYKRGEPANRKGKKKNIQEQRRGQGRRAPSSYYRDHLIILCDLLTSTVGSRHGQWMVTGVLSFFLSLSLSHIHSLSCVCQYYSICQIES